MLAHVPPLTTKPLQDIRLSLVKAAEVMKRMRMRVREYEVDKGGGKYGEVGHGLHRMLHCSSAWTAADVYTGHITSPTKTSAQWQNTLCTAAAAASTSLFYLLTSTNQTGPWKQLACSLIMN